MRFFKLLEIIALALLVIVCIINGDATKGSTPSPLTKAKIVSSTTASAYVIR